LFNNTAVLAAPSVSKVTIAPTVEPPTHKVLTDFFSFCGNIAALSINPVDDTTVSAIVTFETEGAAKTAVLLNNALINDRAISVEIAPIGFVPPSSSVNSDQLPHNAVPPGERTEASVVQAMMDSGYKLGTDALDTAKQWDAQTGVTQTLSSGIAVITAKVGEIDQSFQISNKAKAFGDSVSTKVGEVNQEYQLSTKATEAGGHAINFISESASAVATGAVSAASTVTNFVNTNPQVNQSIQTVQAVGSAIGQTLSDTFGSLFSTLSVTPQPTPAKQ